MISDMETVIQMTTNISNMTNILIPPDGLLLNCTYCRNTREIINIIVCPLILVIGTTGNILSFLTMTRSKLRTQATSLYLAALAINDSGALWFGLFRHYLLYGYGIEIRQTNVSCKLHVFFTYLFMHNASMLLSVVGIERYACVCGGGKYRNMLSVKTTYIIITIVSTFVAIFELHYIVFYRITLHPIKAVPSCTVDPDVNPIYYYLRENVIAYLQLIVFYLIPFLVLILTDLGIINNIVKSSRRINVSISKRRVTMSMMMISVSFYFLMTTPAQLYLSFVQFLEKRQNFLMEWTVTTLIYYTHHALNFFFYCLTSSLFRNELLQMTSSWRKFIA
ncbi:hypothetical protein GJ496_006802 [Pomphorhynchus laevis]|nr:hypothetical protein GJ496_006802 [Pomphorhynchus laevis]